MNEMGYGMNYEVVYGVQVDIRLQSLQMQMTRVPIDVSYDRKTHTVLVNLFLW